jgi:hypothetical protein
MNHSECAECQKRHAHRCERLPFAFRWKMRRLSKLLKSMSVRVEVTGGSFRFVAAPYGGLSAYPLDLSQRIEPEETEAVQQGARDSAIVWREPQGSQINF